MSDSKVKIVSRAIGRRKAAIASVRLIAGNGDIIVNGKPASEYFPGVHSRHLFEQPFKLLSLTKYSATVKTHGGGIGGQLKATVLALSRAISELKPDHKNVLRQAGLLTRDSRERQRRMIGTGGKARRRKQSPKR